ncbi:ATP-dependent DNA helicase PIF1-like [Panicum virgatum]|uniref:ATP-dependent DNA helicase PIF1-like n=1 Tax=Panicum virgatum TaxID=38727 RepID=UPI0019D6441C|nr:ATP-dependent DNA helicase PIF1-like [Panicum virgatum]
MELVESDKSLDDCLRESAEFRMTYSLWKLFATIMVFCECANIRRLWDDHLDSMSEDFRRICDNSSIVEQMVLRDISYHLTSMGKDIKHYGLPEIHQTEEERSRDHYRELTEEHNLGFDEDHLKIVDTLNAEQMADGPSGTGKTYLYKTLIAKVRSMNLIAVAIATSALQSKVAQLIRRASLIIWDEVAMTKRQAVEALDRSLRDIMGCDMPFGGKVMLFGGDFRQVLPVVPHDYLLRIGDGTEEAFDGDYMWLPDDILIHNPPDDDFIDFLIDRVFPDLVANCTSATYMREFSGKQKVFYSFDSVNDDSLNNYSLDFLNSITPNGLPPHELKVKKNCPVILLRNLDPHNGLCNGTRLVVRGFQNNSIDAEIVNGQHAGKRVFIPRIPMSPSEDITLPFKFKKKQFPIRLSFAMTINKAQGQTIPNVGIYLPEPVFSHGQLYVALSRGVSHETIPFSLPHPQWIRSPKKCKSRDDVLRLLEPLSRDLLADITVASAKGDADAEAKSSGFG